MSDKPTGADAQKISHLSQPKVVPFTRGVPHQLSGVNETLLHQLPRATTPRYAFAEPVFDGSSAAETHDMLVGFPREWWFWRGRRQSRSEDGQAGRSSRRTPAPVHCRNGADSTARAGAPTLAGRPPSKATPCLSCACRTEER